ncbi:MAG: STT3 domain-containing protein [Candidatus Woesearchaeota archaeon]
MDDDFDDEEISFDMKKVKGFFKKVSGSFSDDDKSLDALDEKKKDKKDIHEEIEKKKEELRRLEAEKGEESQRESQKKEENGKKEEYKEKAIKEDKREVAWKKKDIINEDNKTEKDDDELNIDFSGIKNFFKKKAKKEKSEDEEKDEEFSDVTKTIKKGYTYIKNKPWIIPTILIIFILLFCVYFSANLRYQSAILPITDVWARDNIYNGIRAQVENKVNNEYPNLPDENKAKIIEKEFEKILSENKKEIDNAISASSNQFKSRLRRDITNSKGEVIGEFTYLLAIDPYYWTRHARNILNNGHPGDELRDGKPFDNHMFAPLGRFIVPDMLHAYLSAYLFKVFQFFNRDLDLMSFIFLMPILISALAVIPGFFITRRLAGNYGGFAAGFLIAVHAAFLNRTMGGFSDTDAYSVTLPLYTAWFFLIAFEEKDLKKKIIYSALSGILIGLLGFAWTGGWWYMFYLIIISTIIYAIGYLAVYLILNYKKGIKINQIVKLKFIKYNFIILIVFIMFSGIFITMFLGFNEFYTVVEKPMGFVTLKQIGATSVWPNVFTTVAEQNESSFPELIGNIGGTFLFFLSLLGILFVFIKGIIFLIKDKEGGLIYIKYSILLVLWFAATVYSGIKGIRFILLFVPAFSIAVGLALGIIYQYAVKIISNELKINKLITQVVIIALLSLILIKPLQSAQSTAYQDIPSMTDEWWSSLEKIRLESSENAIITSWWDFGHWFKYIADRPVTFDGTSQDSPMAHWVGYSLLTSDEDISVGILRMLDCGSNNAFDELDKVINETYKSVDTIYEIIVLEKEEAREVLKEYGLNEEQAENVLKNTHCEPPEAYFITSSDMIGKSGVWGHFGIWNFRRSTMYNKIKDNNLNMDKGVKYLKDEFNMTDDEAQAIYLEIQSLGTGRDANDWTAPWPSYASGIDPCTPEDEGIYICSLFGGGAGLFNSTSMELVFSSAQGIDKPKKLVILNETGIITKEYENGGDFGVLMIPTEDGFSRLITNVEQTDSIFTQLYFLDGHGTKHFKKFSEENSVLGQRIVVWKVDWEGKQENVYPFFQQDVTIEEISEEEYNATEIDNVENIEIDTINKSEIVMINESDVIGGEFNTTEA